jgi:hypothetical protein
VLLELRARLLAEPIGHVRLDEVAVLDALVVHVPTSKVLRPGQLSLLPELLEALSRPVEHPVELQAGQTVVGLDALLALLPEVVAAEQITVPVHRQLLHDLPNQPDLLGPGHQLCRVGLVILQESQTSVRSPATLRAPW